MDCINKIRHLRVINYFNLNGPYYQDENCNTDLTVAKTIHDFVEKYKSEIRQNYTFIIKYDNDIFSYLAFCLIRNSIAVAGKDIDTRVLGEIKTKQEKNIFKGVKTIGLKRALKHKKAVLITGFNPICNVNADKNFSKFFIEIYHPLEHFTPKNLRILQSFYLEESENDNLRISDLGHRNEEESVWYDYFSHPITNLKDNDKENYETKVFIKKHLEILRKNPVPIVIFKLSGTEEDFSLYDFILKSSKEGNIHLYYGENIDFIKNNLSPYIDYRNAPNFLNIISKEDYNYLKENANKSIFFFDYKNFSEEKENE